MGEEEVQVTEPEEGIVSEIDDPNFVQEDEEPEEKVDKKDKEDDAEDQTDDKKDAKEDKDEKKSDDPVEVLKKEYDAKLEAKDKEINRLGYALRTGKKDEGKKDEDTQFTDAQLLAILEQHKDDPRVMLQVFKEIASSKGKEIEKGAEKAADIKMKSNEMERVVSAAYPETLKEGTEQYDQVTKTIEWLHLGEHPMARYLAVGALALQNIPKLVEKVKEDTKKEILSETADKKRKQSIKKNAPAGSGDGNSQAAGSGLTASQLETAKKLFGNNAKLIARYTKIVTGGSGSFTANI